MGTETIVSSDSREQNTIKEYTKDDIGKINNELQKSEREANLLVDDISIVNENYNQMMEMVKEYEITVQKLVADKEKELVCKEIELERHSKLKDEIIQDHQNVERAFNDLSQKYERTRFVVVGLQEQEEDLKKKVEDLSQKHTQKEELFEQTKEKVTNEPSQAEMKLFEKKTNGEGEIARLRALKKSRDE